MPTLQELYAQNQLGAATTPDNFAPIQLDVPIVDVPASLVQSKSDALQQRMLEKQTKLGVLKNVYDADTYTMQGDPTSTRAFGVDAYESTKTGDWFNNPYNAKRLEKQQAQLSLALGRPATIQDVFAAGDTQAQEAKSILSTIGADGKPLPAIVTGQQVLNQNPLDKSPQNNYGRNLGAISTIGGMATMDDGTEVDTTQRIGTPFITNQEAAQIPTISDTDTVGGFGEGIDTAQAGGYKALAQVDKLLDKTVEMFGLTEVSKAIDEFVGLTKTAEEFSAYTSNFMGDSGATAADKEAGVQAATRVYQQANRDVAEKAFDRGEEAWKADDYLGYIKAKSEEYAANASNIFVDLGDSAAEMAMLAAKAPGLALAVSVRTSANADDYKKNNNGNSMPVEEIALAAALNTASLGTEQLVIKTGAINALKSMAGKNKIADGVLGFVTSAAGEYTQERFDYTIETFLGRDRSKDTGTAEDMFKTIWSSKKAQLAGDTGAAMGATLQGGAEATALVAKSIAAAIPTNVKQTSKGTPTEPSKVFADIDTLLASINAPQSDSKVPTTDESTITDVSAAEQVNAATEPVIDADGNVIQTPVTETDVTPPRGKTAEEISAMASQTLADVGMDGFEPEYSMEHARLVEQYTAEDVAERAAKPIKTEIDDNTITSLYTSLQALETSKLDKNTVAGIASRKASLEGLMSSRGIEIPVANTNVPEESYEAPSEAEVASARDQFKAVMAKVKVGQMVGDEDISTMDATEELVNRYPENTKEEREKKASAQASVQAAKKLFTEHINNSDDVSDFRFGATSTSMTDVERAEKAHELIFTAVEGADGVTTPALDAKLAKIAAINGMTKEAFKKTISAAKNAAQVEMEATTGHGGYRTYAMQMAKLVNAPAPDTTKISKLVKRVKGFEESQSKYAEVLKNKLSDVTDLVNTYNSSLTRGLKIASTKPKSKYTVEIPQKKASSKWEIHVREVGDGTYEIDKSTAEMIATKTKNAEALSNILKDNATGLDSAGVKAKSFGIISDKITIDKSGKVTDAEKKDADKYATKKISKVITPPNDTHAKDVKGKQFTVSNKWRSNPKYAGNESNVNATRYTKDDVVLLSIPSKMRKGDLVKEFADSTSTMVKALNAAVKAGATIEVEAYGEGLVSVVAAQLATYKGYAAVRKLNEKNENVATTTFKPKEVVKESNEAVKVERTKIVTGNEANKVAADKAVLMYANGATIEQLVEDVEIAKLFAQFSEKENPTEAFESYIENIYNKKVEAAKKVVKAYNKETENGIEALGLTEAEKAYNSLEEVYRDEAEAQLKIAGLELERYSELVEEYSQYIAEGDIEAAAALLKESEHSVVNEILANSVSKDMPVAYVYTDAEGTKQGTTSLKNKGLVASEARGDLITTQELNINKIVKAGTANILNSVHVAQMGDAVAAYLKPFKESLAKILQPKDKIAVDKLDRTDPTTKGKKLYTTIMHDDPARALLYTLDEYGNEVTNENVLLALELAMDEFIAYNAPMLDTNFKSDDDIARMFNIDSTAVTNELREFAKDKGMFQKSLSNSIGKAALSKMGLSSKKDIDPETFTKLVAAVGNIATQHLLKDTAHFAQEAVSVAKVTKALGMDASTIITDGDNAEVYFVKFRKYEDGSTKVKDFLAEKRMMFEGVHANVADELVFRKEPKLKPIKNSKHAGKVAKTRVGAITSTIAEKIMEGLRKITWDVDLDTLKATLGVVETEDGIEFKNEENLKSWLGFTEDEAELDKMSFYDRDGQVSRNRDILKSIDELKRLVGIDKTKLYFDWFYSINGRYMMDSNTLNPQTDKLHRFIINPIARVVSLTKKDSRVFKKNVDITAEFDYAIAQALGFGVDKKETKTTNAIGEVMRQDDGTLLAALKEALDTHSEFKIEVNGETLKLEPDHISHAYQALDALTKFQSGTAFKTSLTAETDAVTSGFALKLRQLPILGGGTETMMKWLNKTGTFRFKDLEQYKADIETASMNDILSEGKLRDSYQELAVNVYGIKDTSVKEYMGKKYKGKAEFRPHTWTALSKLLPKVDGEIISSELRTLFKSPFMTFNYSAGMKSIRRALTNNITNEIVTKMINADDKSDKQVDKDAFELLKLLAESTGHTTEDLKHLLRTKPLYAITGNGVKMEVALNAYIDSSYGEKVESIMKDEFGPFIEAQEKVNNSFKAMFLAFNIEYKQAIKDKIRENKTVTNDDKLAIIEKLRTKFPAIRGPLSEESETSAYVHLYKTRSVPVGPDSNLAAAQTHVQGDVATRKVSHEIRIFEEAISAGSVVPIHFIDGAIMGKLLEEHGFNLTAIHDAIMMQLGDIAAGAKTYNKVYKEVSENYSFIAEIQKQLEKIDFDKLTREYTDELNVVYIKGSTKHNTEAITAGEFIKSTIEGFKELSETVAKARAELKAALDGNAVYVHMASMPGGAYVDGMIPTSKVNEVTEPFEATSVEDELMSLTNKEESEYNVATKEALLQLFTTNTGIVRTLKLNRIDLTDC